MLMRERKERRRRYEEQLRRREQHYSAVQELRRADAVTRYNEEVQRRHQLRLQQQRRRYEALALTQNEGALVEIPFTFASAFVWKEPKSVCFTLLSF
jgi:hypothetical protein